MKKVVKKPSQFDNVLTKKEKKELFGGASNTSDNEELVSSKCGMWCGKSGFYC